MNQTNLCTQFTSLKFENEEQQIKSSHESSHNIAISRLHPINYSLNTHSFTVVCHALWTSGTYLKKKKNLHFDIIFVLLALALLVMISLSLVFVYL